MKSRLSPIYEDLAILSDYILLQSGALDFTYNRRLFKFGDKFYLEFGEKNEDNYTNERRRLKTHEDNCTCKLVPRGEKGLPRYCDDILICIGF